jgi:hypothetical protein
VWVVEVAAGSLLGVEAGRWDEVGMPVGPKADLPAGVRVVDESVVVAAEQHEVVQGRGPALGPGGDVVGVGPVKRSFVPCGSQVLRPATGVWIGRGIRRGRAARTGGAALVVECCARGPRSGCVTVG